jgi:hypothetical protein
VKSTIKEDNNIYIRFAVLIKEDMFAIMIDIKKIGDCQSCDELIAMATKEKEERFLYLQRCAASRLVNGFSVVVVVLWWEQHLGQLEWHVDVTRRRLVDHGSF